MSSTVGMNLSTAAPFDEDALLPARPAHDEAKFDITAMIDLVFMMNIFFLVTTVGAALAEIDLPTARHCAPADRDSCVVLTMTGGERGPVQLFVDDGPGGTALTDQAAQEQQTREAVQAGVRSGRMTVLIKAERSVRLRDVSRIGAVATSVPGTDLKVSVIEKE